MWQRFALDYCFVRIAEYLSIGVSAVKRILQLFVLTGGVAKKAYPAGKASRKISESVQFFILHLLKKGGV